MFHGHTESAEEKWEANAPNPREPGKYSFENLQFMLDEGFLDKLLSNGDVAAGKSNSNCADSAQIVLAYLISPEGTGLCDELCALHRAKIVDIKSGIPRLSRDWYTRADLLLLNDMQDGWAPEVDKAGKYLMYETVRRKLSEKWLLLDDGWALKAESDEVIYDFDEWDEWRDSFSAKQEAESDDIHGIGRFGL